MAQSTEDSASSVDEIEKNLDLEFNQAADPSDEEEKDNLMTGSSNDTLSIVDGQSQFTIGVTGDDFNDLLYDLQISFCLSKDDYHRLENETILSHEIRTIQSPSQGVLRPL